MASTRSTLKSQQQKEEEEELSPGFTKLLLSLPKERGWRTPHLYQYEGFWYQEKQLQGTILFQKHFQAQDTDILLSSIPRSSTIWLKALIFALVNREIYTIAKEHPLLTHDPHALIPLMEYHVYSNNQIPDLSNQTAPRLFATHVPFSSLPESIKTTDSKIVYICRNPLDVFTSLWHLLKKLRPENMSHLSTEEAFDMYCNGFSAFGPCWDHMLGYWKESLQSPHKVLFIKYEDMKKDPTNHIKRLAEYLGFPFSKDEESQGIRRLCNFETMKGSELNRDPDNAHTSVHMLRKGEVGDWVNHLSPSMAEKLSKIIKEKLAGSGLSFE